MSARFGAVLAAGVVAAVLLPSSAAFALGNNRTVTRSCGSNYISSGWSAPAGSFGRAWAQTQKAGGSCAGSLGASIQLWNGIRTPRVNDSTNALAEYRTATRPQNGVHWGCLSCAVTLS